MKEYLFHIENAMDRIKKPLYISSLFIINLIYVLAYLGMVKYNTTILDYLNIGIQLFVALFLMIKFHPYRKHELREFDAQIIFGCAIFLLVNLGLTEYFERFTKNIVSKIELKFNQ
jgi:hypothetical protein